MLVRDPGLAFRVMHAWDMPALEAYCSAARQAATAGDHAALKQLLANIQGTAAADDFDKARTGSPF